MAEKLGGILHKEGEFVIRKNITLTERWWSDRFQSVIHHNCYDELRSNEMKTDALRHNTWCGTWSVEGHSSTGKHRGQCQNCYVKIPEGLLALWKLHNWDSLQKWYGEVNGKD